jgi:hypothetical protein
MASLSLRGSLLPLLFFAGLLVMTVFAKVGEDPRLLAFLLEPLEGPFEILVIVNDDFRHATNHPSLPPNGGSG